MMHRLYETDLGVEDVLKFVSVSKSIERILQQGVHVEVNRKDFESLV